MEKIMTWAGVIGRLGLALLFLWSGYEKLANPAFTVADMQSMGYPRRCLDVACAPLELVGERCWFSAGRRGGWRSAGRITFAATFVFMRTGALPRPGQNEQIHFMSNLAIGGRIAAGSCARLGPLCARQVLTVPLPALLLILTGVTGLVDAVSYLKLGTSSSPT